MIEVKRSTPATLERVWAVLSDVDNWPRVLPTFDSVSRVGGDARGGVGARFEVKQPGLAKAVYEITEWQSGRSFTWVSAASGVRTTASHRLEAEANGTRLILTVVWSGPLAWLARLLFGRKSSKMVQQEADIFVRLAEDAGRRG